MNYLHEFEKLRNSLPRLALGIVNNENCDYCNYIDQCKSCYLLVSAYESEKCYYGKFNFFCNWCMDTMYLEKCELCYECIDCKNCYNCNYLQDCENCTDSEYCIFTKGCNNCFLCINVRQKQYYILNKPYSRQEYSRKIQEIKEKGKKYLEEKIQKLKLDNPHPPLVEENNENSSGHHIFNNKNVQYCYETKHSQDCIHSTELFTCEDCTDILIGDYSKWCYDCISAYKLHNSDFCYNCWESSDLSYCEQCYQCQNCFFCSNLQHKKYYIFNKPYLEEEYFQKKQEIIEKMKKDNIYGKNIPSTYPEKDSMIYY